MEASSDDGQFALKLTASSRPRFSTLLLSFGGLTIGDDEPAIVWSDLDQLNRLSSATDPGLDPGMADAGELWARLEANGALHDRHLVQLGESFDDWKTFGWAWADKAVFLIRGSRSQPLLEPTLFSVDLEEYRRVVGMALSAYVEGTPPT